MPTLGAAEGSFTYSELVDAYFKQVCMSACCPMTWWSEQGADPGSACAGHTMCCTNCAACSLHASSSGALALLSCHA